jgi:hypothetical protein
MKKKSDLTKKQLESLAKLSEILNKSIPRKISNSKNPKREANRILMKWSQEYGNLKLKRVKE